MEIYKLTPLTSLVWFQEGPGVRNTQYTNSGVKLLNVANLIDGHIDLSTSNRYIAEEEAYGRYRHFLCDKGDLVIASSGIKVDYFDKKMGFVRQEHLPLCMNTSTIRFKVLDKNILNIRYFMYFLKSNFFKSQLSKQITGSAQLNFGPSHLKRMIVPLINIDYQNHICGILDKVYELEYKLQTELTLLNQLVKSRFIEMFGDPVSNSQDRRQVPFSEFITDIRYGTSQPPKFSASGEYKFIRATNIKRGRIVPDDILRIDKSGASKIEKCRLDGGEIIIVRSGVNTGDTCVVTDEYKGQYAGYDIIIKLDLKKANPIFFNELLNTHYMNDVVKPLTVRSAQPHLNSQQVQNLPMIVVSIDEQNEFAAIVAQSDKSRLAVQKSLDELEILKKSLMQQYFG